MAVKRAFALFHGCRVQPSFSAVRLCMHFVAVRAVVCIVLTSFRRDELRVHCIKCSLLGRSAMYFVAVRAVVCIFLTSCSEETKCVSTASCQCGFCRRRALHTTSSASRSKGRKQGQHNPLHANRNRGEKVAWRGVLEKESRLHQVLPAGRISRIVRPHNSKKTGAKSYFSSFVAAFLPLFIFEV